MKVAGLSAGLSNELTLLGYSLRMLMGRNLVAVGLISVVLVLTVSTYTVSLADTRLSVLLAQLELFAPLLGIVIFSDLLAADIEARRVTLLMTSRHGIVPVLLRKLVHAALITSAAYLAVLFVLRLFYTSFDLLPAFLIVVPGAFYFGMIGLLGATCTSRALAGYALGTSALTLSMVSEQILPLTPAAFRVQQVLANETLWQENNWLLAKIVFAGLAVLLAIPVVLMVRNRATRLPVMSGVIVLLAGFYIVLHRQWAAEVPPRIRVTVQGKQLDVLQAGDRLRIRTATVQEWGTGADKTHAEAMLSDTKYALQDGRWVRQQEGEYDPATEYEVVHVDMDARLVPESASLEATARVRVQVYASRLDRAYLHLGWDLQVSDVRVNDQSVTFTRLGDLVDIPLPASATTGQTLEVRMSYAGTLHLPSAHHRSERNDRRVLMSNSLWYPFSKSWYHEGPVDTFTYDVRVALPTLWQLAAGEPAGQVDGETVWRMRTGMPCERIPLLATRAPHFQLMAGDIPLTVYSHSLKPSAMKKMAERSADVLAYFQTVFGPYPHHTLAVVEYEYLGAGGVAMPGVVLLNPRRCRPEHRDKLMDLYLPHEVSHQWFDSTLPGWIAEGAAVFANYLYLAQAPDADRTLAVFHDAFTKDFDRIKGLPIPLAGSKGETPYTKGGYLLIMLHALNPTGTIGALQAFLADHQPRQLLRTGQVAERYTRAMQQAAGSDWTDFVADWIHSVHSFDPAVASLTQTPSADGYTVRGSLAQYGQMHFAVPLRLTFEDGTSFDATHSTRPEAQPAEWKVAKPVRSITLDPNRVVLDWNRLNNTGVVRTAADGNEPAAPAAPAPAAGPWSIYTVIDGLIDNYVRCLDVGPDRRLYAGIHQLTRKAGVLVQRLDETWVQPDSSSDPTSPIHALAVAANGDIWAASPGRIRRMEPDGTTLFTTTQLRGIRSFKIGRADLSPNPQANSRIPGYVIYDLALDHRDRIWVATDDGIAVIDREGQLLDHLTSVQGLPGREVLCMAWQGQDTLWIGTEAGCASLRDGVWHRHPACPQDAVLAIAIAPDGMVYLGTYRHGVVAYDGHRARRYHHANSRLPHDMVTAMLVDHQGRVWAGTAKGVFCMDGDAQQVFNTDNSGLRSNRVTDLATDGQRVFVATDAGIAAWSPGGRETSDPGS